MKILFLGDIVGKGGRRAVKKVLPTWREKYQPDFVIANGENLAHGAGVTEKTIAEMTEVGIDAFTSGNHIFQNKQGVDVLNNKESNIIRPANYPPGAPGIGWKIFPVRTKKILLVNLIGRVFFKDDYDCPFRVADDILEETKSEKPDVIFVDMHMEATSEAKALGFHLDGRVSAVVGTHTHVPTADERVLSGGTAYITDVGMAGPQDSVIGAKKEVVTEQFLTQLPFKYDVEEEGVCEVNGVVVEIGAKGKAKKIERVHEEVEV
ncbi:MAG: TIGR00282 family metallophosphoesterase [Parcubacteria group bacterium]|nr:TIGR00282 family metallophosphoesterase [Parcubacteria group bacterium]